MNPIFEKTRKLFCLLAALSIISMTFLPASGMPAARVNVLGRTAFVSDAVVREWNLIAFTTIPAPPPFPATRAMAIVQLAVFEAVNAITGRYEPYLSTINAPPGASPEAAAIMAAHGVLVALVPSQASFLNQRRDASLALIPDGQAKIDGIQVGMAAAAAMLANRANDGSSPATFHVPPNSDPYQWQTYAGCPTGGGAFFNWQNVTPFGIESSSQFRAEPPPPLESGMYAQDFNELQNMGGVNSAFRPQDRTDVARLYAVAGPPNLWNAVLLQILSTRNDDITDTARTMALLNMAVGDAAISVFDSKYHYRTWRPITAIPRGGDDGNIRTTAGAFTPLITTPCFPAYPSAHGTLSNAALQILELTYGRFGHSLSIEHPSLPGLILYYSDLREIGADISDARVYGGIHFRFDQVAGERQGDAVAGYIFSNLLQRRRL